MSNPPDSAPASGKKRRGLKILGALAAALLLVLIVTYFVVTSSGFFKSFILPRVSRAANATVTVESASISPFSRIVLRNLKVQTTGGEPLVAAQEVRARYQLLAVLGGNLNVEEITLVSPTVNLVGNADGTSNLDPLLKSRPAKGAQPAPATKGSPPKIKLKKLSLTNATIRQTQSHPGGAAETAEIANVNVTLTDLGNGQSGKLTLGADVKYDRQTPVPAASGNLQANIAGEFAFALAADLKPLAITGHARLAVSQAGGTLAGLTALTADLDCEVTPTEIKNVALRFQKSGQSLGGLLVSGLFDAAKTEGRFAVELRALDRQVLNLAGAASGLDFGSTTINSTNQIELTKAGDVITAGGRLHVATLQVTRARQTTPTLDVLADYRITVDRTARTALFQTLTVNATQNRSALLRADLSSPMTLAWGNSSSTVGDSALNVDVTSLNLADWKPFLGEAVSGGNVSLKAKLLSQAGGRKLAFNLDSQIENLTANAGSHQISQANVTLHARGQAADFQQYQLDDYSLQITRQTETLLTAAGNGTYDAATRSADMQVRLQAALPGILQVLPQPDANFSAGTIELTSRVAQKAQAQTVTGQLTIAGLTGRAGPNEFRNFGIRTDLDVTKTGSRVQIDKAAGQLTEDAAVGGAFDVSGNYDLDKQSGRLTAKLTGFNQNGLRPFLQPLLGDKRLVSVSIDATANAQLDPQTESSVKADLQLANLVVNDPKGQFPASPLEAKWQLDASLNKQVADLRQCQITLTPTARARNKLRLTGRVDMAQANAIAGNLRLAADSLDVTGYYDLFAAPTTATTTTAAPAAAPGEQEPEAVQLPFRNFTAEVAIGRFYLREVAAANLQTTLKLDGGKVLLQPFQMTLNGAPVNAAAELNLGVPGYQYDVSFTASGVPIAPLADSFSPAYKGQAQGDFFASARIKGAGVTGGSLQKSLAGDVSIVLTNANLQLVGPKAKTLITPIALVLGLNELTTSPLSGLNAQIRMGGGQIALTQFDLLSDAYRADVKGVIPIAPVLNHSPINNWPINLSLSRHLAGKAHLLSADTPTNATFVKLPTFAKLGGTVGKPEAKTDKLVIAGLVARSVGGISGVAGSDAGKILQGIGSLLGGPTAPAVQTPAADTATNPPAARPNPPVNLFDLFKKK